MGIMRSDLRGGPVDSLGRFCEGRDEDSFREEDEYRRFHLPSVSVYSLGGGEGIIKLQN
jgi:hypothetical protein